MSKDDHVARELSWQSARTVSEDPGYESRSGQNFSFPVTFDGSVWDRG